MSRFYEMAIEVTGIKGEKRRKIHNVLKREWNVEGFHFEEDHAGFFGQGTLTGGESEDEFAERIARAVWKANGAYCRLEVKATYLEELPFEIHSFGRKHYERFKKRAKSERLRRERQFRSLNGSKKPVRKLRP